MKLPLNWLKDHLETSATAEEIAATLDQLGHEVDSITDTRKTFDKVVIGYVKERVQHPDADRLGVCQVDVGEGELRQIVCGAPNARTGITVAVAMPGAKLPGDFKIKKSKIRGVESCGMICSERELELGDDHNGIMELEISAKPGSRFDATLGEGDTIFELELTPNRGDCFNIRGLARELAAAGLGTLKPLPTTSAGKAKLNVTAATKTELCPFFSGISVTGIKNQASPTWLKTKLESIGLRPRNAVVDIANYVMFDLGQPLHTYDAAKLKGTIYATTGQTGSYTGIGEVKVTLDKQDIAICDDSGIIGLGGVLGGESTAVTDDTTDVYIEAALFNRKQIALTGQRLGLHTDARQRFERGIDPALTATAAQRAAALIQEICGGEVSVQQAVGTADTTPEQIHFNPEYVKNFGGLDLDTATISKHLTALGFKVTAKGDNLILTPPSWRTYMATQEDVVEEILRLENYENVPSTLPRPLLHRQNIAAPGLATDRLCRRGLSALGFTEVITYSFINHSHAEAFANGASLRSLANPIDEDTMATLRPSLIPGLLGTAKRNNAHTTPISHLAEVGKVFRDNTETLSSAGAIQQSDSRHWQTKPATVDCFAAKGVAEELLKQLGAPVEKLQISTENLPPYLHPGRSGRFMLGPKNELGVFGEVHPTLLKQFDLAAPVAVFELNLDPLQKMKNKPKAFNSSNFQPVERDLAFVVAADVPAGDVLNTVRNAVKELATEVSLFDVYTGDKLPKGKKSLAVSMTLQAPDRTLNEAEINTVVQAAVEACAKHYDATLRDS